MAIKIESDAIYDEQETAQILGWSVSTLQTRRSKGGGPTFVKLGRTIRYHGEDLLSFISERRFENTAQL